MHLHFSGNAGCRLDADDVIRLLLPTGISVVSFDCAGSGISEGEYVSLGFYEQHDLATVVNHLRNNGQTTRIGSFVVLFSSDPHKACGAEVWVQSLLCYLVLLILQLRA